MLGSRLCAGSRSIHHCLESHEHADASEGLSRPTVPLPTRLAGHCRMVSENARGHPPSSSGDWALVVFFRHPSRRRARHAESAASEKLPHPRSGTCRAAGTEQVGSRATGGREQIRCTLVAGALLMNGVCGSDCAATITSNDGLGRRANAGYEPYGSKHTADHHLSGHKQLLNGDAVVVHQSSASRHRRLARLPTWPRYSRAGHLPGCRVPQQKQSRRQEPMLRYSA